MYCRLLKNILLHEIVTFIKKIFTVKNYEIALPQLLRKAI